MQFKLGTVVSLKSNGLLPLASHHFLSLGGDEKFTTPLMVVVEILYATQLEIDEESREEKNPRKGRNKYKCAYFSTKSMKIEENWFAENELLTYGDLTCSVNQNEVLSNIKWGDTVRFKTVDEEAKKTKTYNLNEKPKGVKPLLTYTSPAMQVIGFANTDKKEPLIDPHTGEKKREKSQKMVKCKFFNSDSDKFSEQLIPIECLQVIDYSELEDQLKNISSILTHKELGIFSLKSKSDDVEKMLLGNPINTSVLSGRYQLLIYNELLKRNEFIWLDEIENIESINVKEGSEYYPGFHEVEGGRQIIDVQAYIANKNTNLKDKYFKIVYKNLKDEINSRYILVKEVSKLIPVSIEPNTENPIKGFYLKSHCFFREEEREFRSDRVLSIRTIENEKLIEFLDSILN